MWYVPHPVRGKCGSCPIFASPRAYGNLRTDYSRL